MIACPNETRDDHDERKVATMQATMERTQQRGEADWVSMCFLYVTCLFDRRDQRPLRLCISSYRIKPKSHKAAIDTRYALMTRFTAVSHPRTAEMTFFVLWGRCSAQELGPTMRKSIKLRGENEVLWTCHRDFFRSLLL